MKNEHTHTNHWKQDLKENPFNIPANYFDSFEEKLMAKIEQPENTGKKSGKIIHLLKPFLSIAASLLLIAILSYYPLTRMFPGFMAQSGNKTKATDSLALASFGEKHANASTDAKTDLTDSEEIVEYLASELTDYELSTTLN